ncbi:MAG: hypothetical protein MUD17_03910 [Gemmatimonadaceae bacterium]|jgi:hypothetical protein|nr:hypothetical protein [Gemmatimonadaceae bacterium]
MMPRARRRFPDAPRAALALLLATLLWLVVHSRLNDADVRSASARRAAAVRP